MALPMGAMAMDGSGEAWGSRDPGGCAPVALGGPPSVADVQTMLRCRQDVEYRGEITLIEDIAVRVGSGVPFTDLYNTYVMDAADVTATVYPITGSYRQVSCMSRADAAIYGDPDRNCTDSLVPQAKGVCWPTETGEGKCFLSGPVAERRTGTAPPR